MQGGVMFCVFMQERFVLCLATICGRSGTSIVVRGYC